MAGMTSWTRHCFQHLLVSLWKRKHVVLAIVIVSTLLLVAVQYSSVSSDNQKNGSERLFGASMNKQVSDSEKSHGANIPRRNLSALNSQRFPEQKIAEKASYESSNNPVDETHPIPSINDRYQHRQQQQQQQSETFNANANAQQGQYGIFDAPKPAIANRENNQRHDALISGRVENAGQPQAITNGQRFIPPFRLVHIDLKGAPPKISYYKQVFPLMKEAGANGILLEYEDMFPFMGQLKPAAALNAYSKDDIKALVDLAKIYSFEVIPLVQTFGHLEYFLKLPEYRSIREVDEFPQALCPSRNESFNLVTQIIDQVVMMHPTSKWLHIGCDEVFHLGYCDKCRYKEHDTLFLSHVARVATYTRQKHNVIPIIWDDMLRQFSVEKIKEVQLGKLVEPMIWTYIRDIYRFIPYSNWMSYAELFDNIWTASAFKGAFGETLTVPNVKMHLENNEAWLEVMNEQQRNFKSIRGIAITGWQRYDHLGTLCETLPAGMVSLIINLLTTSQGHYDGSSLFKKFDKIMQCTATHNNYYASPNNEGVDFENDPYLWQRASSCFFPGSAVFRMTQQLSEAIKRVNDYLYDVTVHKAWLTDYNVRHNITSPARVDEGLQEYSSVYYTLTSLVRTAKEALEQVFDDYTVAEWIEQNIYPYLIKMETLMKNSVELKKAKTWPRRPLPMLNDLKRFAVGTDQNAAINNNNNAYG